MGTGVVANHSIANAHIRSDPLDQNGLTIETNDRDRWLSWYGHRKP